MDVRLSHHTPSPHPERQVHLHRYNERPVAVISTQVSSCFMFTADRKQRSRSQLQHSDWLRWRWGSGESFQNKNKVLNLKKQLCPRLFRRLWSHAVYLSFDSTYIAQFPVTNCTNTKPWYMITALLYFSFYLRTRFCSGLCLYVQVEIGTHHMGLLQLLSNTVKCEV